MLAATAGKPSAVKVGNVINVPPPASALTAPAAKAARAAMRNCHGVMMDSIVDDF
jgi:hypothetical protein